MLVSDDVVLSFERQSISHRYRSQDSIPVVAVSSTIGAGSTGVDPFVTISVTFFMLHPLSIIHTHRLHNKRESFFNIMMKENN